ncbi:MAG: hypothetical protein NUV81_01855 [bacterium]|nr:hypothetical protein [bacterium]
MFGILLVVVGSFLDEIGISIGKRSVRRKKENIYSFGFLNLFLATVFLGFFALYFVWQYGIFGHLPMLSTFSIRIVLEMFQMYFAIRAITEAERTTNGFLSTGTIPLLLLVDILLGYSISGFQVIGMLCISLGVLFLFINHGIHKKGIGWVIAGTLNGVITISLYKYNISHGNSWQIEQFFVHVALVAFCLFMLYRLGMRKPFRLFLKPYAIIQSATIGIASVLISFAYLLAPASVIVAAKRSSTVIFSVVSGSAVFHEKKVGVKIIATFAFIVGIILLTF